MIDSLSMRKMPGIDPRIVPEQLQAAFPALTLLVLHGSRARGESHAHSDWDFAYRAGSELDPLQLAATLSLALGTDNIDLADLDHCSGLLRYRVASEGLLVLESSAGLHEKFILQAVHFWLDAGQVIAASQEALLKAMG